jgi:hypothetical protein
LVERYQPNSADQGGIGKIQKLSRETGFRVSYDRTKLGNVYLMSLSEQTSSNVVRCNAKMTLYFQRIRHSSQRWIQVCDPFFDPNSQVSHEGWTVCHCEVFPHSTSVLLNRISQFEWVAARFLRLELRWDNRLCISGPFKGHLSTGISLHTQDIHIRTKTVHSEPLMGTFSDKSLDSPWVKTGGIEPITCKSLCII